MWASRGTHASGSCDTHVTKLPAARCAMVCRYTDEYLFAQKALRGLYIEKEAELAQNKYFPTALLSSDLDDAVARTLGGRGFTPRNTLFGHSVLLHVFRRAGLYVQQGTNTGLLARSCHLPNPVRWCIRPIQAHLGLLG